jgi:hypothetical protein
MKKIIILLVVATTMTSCFYDCVQTTYLNGAFYSEYTYAPDPDYGCQCQESSYTNDNGTYSTICTTD